MKRSIERRRLLRIAGLSSVVILALFALVVVPAFAVGTLTNQSWSVSNSQTAKTSATYNFSFTTATTAAITKVTMTVPSGTAGAVAVAAVYGLGAGTVALAGNTITYTITTPASVPAGTSILLSFNTLTNTSTAGSYTSTITTYVDAVATDSAVSPSVTFGSSTTDVTVDVSKTLTFTNDTSSFSLFTDPTGLSVASKVVTLTVQTNAVSGYTLGAYDTGLAQGGATIPAVSVGPGTGVATFPGSGFGVSAVLTGGATSGATLATGLTGGKWVGYPTSVATFLSATNITGASADTLALTNQVAVDYTVPAGSYSDTITYVVTPNY